MPQSPARKAAFQVLGGVESGSAFAVELLQGSQVAGLQEVDRRLATELVMGVLRWRGELDFQIELLSGKSLKYFDSEIVTILRMGIYQIRFLEKIPKAAVVNEAVELAKGAHKRSAAGLVNAVLRKCQPSVRRPEAQSTNPMDAELLAAARRSIPAWLLGRWESHFGKRAVDELTWASNAVPRTTVRVCTGEREEIRRELAHGGIETATARYGKHVLIIRSGNIHSSKLLLQGRVAIQDEASQLVGALVAPGRGERVLDLCAAPGVKTMQLAASLGSGTIVACDLSARRLRAMAKLVAEKVPPGVRLSLLRLDATRDLPFNCEFDKILVDGPCSGTGTLARNPEIKWRLRPEDLPRLAAMQEKLVRNGLVELAPGGRLVYATCSLEPEENEQVVERVLAGAEEYHLLTATELSSEFPELSELFDSCGYFRTRPDLHDMDGFFAAVIVRDAAARVARAA